MKKILVALAFFVIMGFAQAAENTNPADEVSCWISEKFAEYLSGKGYHPLLQMRDGRKVINNIWVGGSHVVITAQKPKKDVNEADYTCFLASMDGVLFNPEAIEEIYKALEKTRKKV